MEDREEQKERDRYWNTENRDEERDGEQRAEIDGEDEHQEADNILEHANISTSVLRNKRWKCFHLVEREG